MANSDADNSPQKREPPVLDYSSPPPSYEQLPLRQPSSRFGKIFAATVMIIGCIFVSGYIGVGSDFVRISLAKKVTFTIGLVATTIVSAKSIRDASIGYRSLVKVVLALLYLMLFMMWFWN